MMMMMMKIRKELKEFWLIKNNENVPETMRETTLRK